MRGGKAYCEVDVPERAGTTSNPFYTFQSFDKTITNVQKAFTTYAQYTTVDENLEPRFIVSFRNLKTEALLYEDVVEEGDVPEYRLPGVPKYDGEGSAVFSGWDKQLVPATKSYTVYATYEKAAEASDGGSGKTGGALTGNPFDFPEAKEVFHYDTPYAGAMHFREQSYGDLKNNAWLDAPAYTIPAGGINPIYFASRKMEGASMTSSSLNLSYVENRAMALLPTYSKTALKAEEGDAYCGPNESLDQTYDFFPAELTEANQRLFSATTTSYDSQENDYRAFAKAHYLSVNDTEKAYLSSLISANNLKADSLTSILNVRDFVASRCKYNLNFADYPSGSDYVVYFLETAKEGICGHFASAFTTLLRVLGVPSRFVTGYLSEAKSGEKVIVTAKQAHAWTEVYFDGIGWIAMDPTPGSDQGALQGRDGSEVGTSSGSSSGTGSNWGDNPFGDVQGDPLIIITTEAAVDSKVYDGKGVSATASYTGTLEAGETIEYNIEEGKSDVGKYSVRLAPKILDATGKDVSSKYAHKIDIIHDEYEITPRSITITTASASKLRDGTALTAPTYTVTGGLADGQSVEVTFLGTQTKPGSSINNVDLASFKIVDGEGNDLSKNYEVKWVYGTLTVN